MPAPDPLEQIASYITDGYWSGGRLRFAGPQISVDITGLTPAGQSLARRAFEAWETVAGLTFAETAGTADIVVDDADSGAYATLRSRGGEITEAHVNVAADWLSLYGTGIGSHSFYVYLHEIGHALGLGHPGPYNETATYAADALFAEDSWQVTLMSYFDQTEPPGSTASRALPVTPMMADILAIQSLYGPPGPASVTAGDTTWGAGTTLDSALGAYLDPQAGGPGLPRRHRGGAHALRSRRSRPARPLLQQRRPAARPAPGQLFRHRRADRQSRHRAGDRDRTGRHRPRR